MCRITEPTTPASTPSKARHQGQVVSVALVAASIIFGSLWSRGLPLRALPTKYLSTACAVVVGFLALLAWFVNYYTGQRLRECNSVTKHLAAISSNKKTPDECIVDLDKVANPEGLATMWIDEVVNKNDSYSILLTGATGYVGSAFLFQLLREIANGEAATGKKVQHKVYVMARAKARKNLSAAQRLEKLRDEPMFAPYKKQWDEVVVAAQSGDLQDINCGMTDEVVQMLKDVNITHVVHCAADVNFNRPLTDSAGINISPALQLQALAQQWPSCRRFVHCSTAFVNPGCGSNEKPMAEQLFSLGKYDPQDLYDSMRGDKKLALAVKEKLAFPNNYVFTKCVAEHLVVRNNKKMELRIVRPAIVGPAWALPYAGWNGEKPSTVTALLLLWGTRVIRFAPLSKRAMPMIPVDVVVNAIIHAMITPPPAPTKGTEVPVNIRNLIWSHKSPRDCIDGMKMADECIPAAVMKHHFSATEAAVSFALIDAVYKLPLVFPILHLIFNLGPLYILQFVCWAVKTCGIKSVLEQVPVVKLLRFSDMLTLYKPYMGRDYYFESSIDVPESMDMNQYSASLFKATHSFWTTLFPGTVEDLSEMEVLPGGRLDLWWALTFPSKNFANRIGAYLGCKILRKTHGSAIVGVNTVEDAATVMMELEKTMSEQKHCVVLASGENQNPLDDVLTKFLAFNMAGLGIDVPHTFGDADLDDSELGFELENIKAQYDRHATLATNFKESAASETFLRSLVESPGEHDYTVIPLCMEYDQSKESSANSTAKKTGLGLWDMLSLYWQVCIQGKYQGEFGSVKVSFGTPSTVSKDSDIKSVVSHVQEERSRLMSTSNNHLAAAEADLKIPTETLINVAPYLNESHPDWATAIAGGKMNVQNQATVPRDGEVEAVLKAICSIFDAADVLAIRARTSLHQKNVYSPSTGDLVKEMESIDNNLKEAASSFIYEAAASIALRKSLSSVGVVGSEEKKEF